MQTEKSETVGLNATASDFNFILLHCTYQRRQKRCVNRRYGKRKGYRGKEGYSPPFKERSAIEYRKNRCRKYFQNNVGVFTVNQLTQGQCVLNLRKEVCKH